jgi:hypothetical protein
MMTPVSMHRQPPQTPTNGTLHNERLKKSRLMMTQDGRLANTTRTGQLYQQAQSKGGIRQWYLVISLAADGDRRTQGQWCVGEWRIAAGEANGGYR